MRLIGIAAGLSLCCAVASAETLPQQPNSVPLNMQRARSYSLMNRSKETIVAAHARMTNNQERDLDWDQPVRPNQARNVAVPSEDCLASLTIKLESGRSLQTNGTPDCRVTQIVVTDNEVQIRSNGTTDGPVKRPGG